MQTSAIQGFSRVVVIVGHLKGARESKAAPELTMRDFLHGIGKAEANTRKFMFENKLFSPSEVPSKEKLSKALELALQADVVYPDVVGCLLRLGVVTRERSFGPYLHYAKNNEDVGGFLSELSDSEKAKLRENAVNLPNLQWLPKTKEAMEEAVAKFKQTHRAGYKFIGLFCEKIDPTD